MDTSPATITIETKMESRDFMRLVYFLTYRRPLVLVVTFLGIVFVVWGMLAVTGVTEFSAFSPSFTVVYGIFFLLWIPATAYFRGRRQYASSKRLQELRSYEFSQEQIKMRSESNSADYKWSGIHEVKFSGAWVLIFLSRAEAMFIPQSAFSAQQLTDFKTLLANVKGLKIR